LPSLHFTSRGRRDDLHRRRLRHERAVDGEGVHGTRNVCRPVGSFFGGELDRRAQREGLVRIDGQVGESQPQRRHLVGPGTLRRLAAVEEGQRGRTFGDRDRHRAQSRVEADRVRAADQRGIVLSLRGRGVDLAVTVKRIDVLSAVEGEGVEVRHRPFDARLDVAGEFAGEGNLDPGVGDEVKRLGRVEAHVLGSVGGRVADRDRVVCIIARDLRARAGVTRVVTLPPAGGRRAEARWRG
jgi:hypothetical protein